jgi:hypothetical protein
MGIFALVHFEGFNKKYPFFEGMQNILKGMWRGRPQNKGNIHSILVPALYHGAYTIVFL